MSLLASYTDEQLFAMMKTGEESAFTEIYHRYAQNLAQYAAGRLASLEEARDIIHDLFVNLWHQRNTVQVHTSLQAYLYTAIRYRIISHIRHNAQQERYQKMLLTLNISISPDDPTGLEINDLHKVVESAIDQLEPRTREIYKLSRHQQLSISEIATHLNISERTVKNQITTALRQLRHAWDKLTILVLLCF